MNSKTDIDLQTASQVLEKELEQFGDLDYQSQLNLLKGYSVEFGVLHEAQVMQLRHWPFSVDPDLPIKGQIVEVDLENRDIKYKWKDSEKDKGWKPDKGYKTRLAILDKWTRWMLGSDFNVRIYMNGKKIHPKWKTKKKSLKQKSSKTKQNS